MNIAKIVTVSFGLVLTLLSFIIIGFLIYIEKNQFKNLGKKIESLSTEEFNELKKYKEFLITKKGVK